MKGDTTPNHSMQSFVGYVKFCILKEKGLIYHLFGDLLFDHHTVQHNLNKSIFLCMNFYCCYGLYLNPV